MNPSLFFLDEKDNVGITFTDLKPGMTVNAHQSEIQVLKDIPKGHKVAVEKIGKGEAVLKYGAVIGYALKDIPVGDHVHIHNIKTVCQSSLNYRYEPSETALISFPFLQFPRLF